MCKNSESKRRDFSGADDDSDEPRFATGTLVAVLLIAPFDSTLDRLGEIAEKYYDGLFIKMYAGNDWEKAFLEYRKRNFNKARADYERVVVLVPLEKYTERYSFLYDALPFEHTCFIDCDEFVCPEGTRSSVASTLPYIEKELRCTLRILSAPLKAAKAVPCKNEKSQCEK